MKIDFEVLLHRIFCLFGKHRWQKRVDYYGYECYWCGKIKDRLNRLQY